MVTQQESPDQNALTWILRPTRSMTWPQAKRFIALVALASFMIGGFFLLLGLPLVLPFSGLEALAVALAFYVSMREGERREIVRIEGDRLTIERGLRKPEEHFEFNRFWVRVELKTAQRRFHPRRLFIASQGRSIELGRFLTDGERESFAAELINALKKNR